jgi:aspartate/methionine/tyrosine aminotransferase
MVSSKSSQSPFILRPTPMSHRMQAVQSPIIPIVGELIRQHPGTISLGQGVVSYGPPPEAIDQISQFLSQPDHHKYQAVEGIAALQRAIEQKLQADNGITLSPDRCIVVTAGSNMAFMNAILAITSPGDEIILPTPYYFNHEMAITMASCHPVLVPTDANHQLPLDQIRQAITAKTRAIVTVSPNNPTGAVYPAAALQAVNQLCRSHDLYHISDEAYEYFTYGVPHFSPGAIAESSPHTISLYSLSKAYGFASWRIGYMVIPQALFEAVRKIQDAILICPPVISQYAAVGALGAGKAYCQAQGREIAQVREMVGSALDRLTPLCTLPPADGAFYFFLHIATALSAMTLVERLIRDHGVAVIPGDTFGTTAGCYLRVAYGALSADTARTGIDRLVQGLKTILA